MGERQERSLGCFSAIALYFPEAYYYYVFLQHHIYRGKTLSLTVKYQESGSVWWSLTSVVAYSWLIDSNNHHNHEIAAVLLAALRRNC